jgi:23S rRNA pseudouridine2605 synthase
MISSQRRGAGQVSLIRALSKLGYASRGMANELVRDRRVAVNGRLVTSPHVWLDLRADRISVDGVPVQRRRAVYLAMYKPRGVVTTRSDERQRSTVYDLLPETDRWIFPVGRLDKESAGLLFFTNDVRFGEVLTSPDRHVPKTYRVQLDRPLTEEHRCVMQEGMLLDDGTTLRRAVVKPHPDGAGTITLTIWEGKNRQIRRMAEALGYVVRDLVRIQIGPVRLGTLREGEVRPLTGREVALLMTEPKKREKHDPRRQPDR